MPGARRPAKSDSRAARTSRRAVSSVAIGVLVPTLARRVVVGLSVGLRATRAGCCVRLLPVLHRAIASRCAPCRLVVPPASARAVIRRVAARFAAVRRWRPAARRLVAPGSITPGSASRRFIAPGSIAGPAAARRVVAPGPIAARTARWRLVAPRPIALRLVAPSACARAAIRRAAVPRWRTAARRFIAPRPIALRLVAPSASACAAIRRATARFLTVRRPRRAELLAIAPRRRSVAVRPRALGPVLFLEPIAWILVLAAGPPVGGAFFPAGARASSCRRAACPLPPLKVLVLPFLRLPQPAARKPLHHDVRVLALQLVERRQQFLALARAEGRRLVVDQNRPVRMARGHACILAGIWDLGFRIRGSGFDRYPLHALQTTAWRPVFSRTDAAPTEAKRMAIEIVAQRPRHVAILIECDTLVGATIDRASEDATLPNPELSGESRVPDPKSRVSSPPANPESQIPNPESPGESRIPNPESAGESRIPNPESPGESRIPNPESRVPSPPA